MESKSESSAAGAFSSLGSSVDRRVKYPDVFKELVHVRLVVFNFGIVPAACCRCQKDYENYKKFYIQIFQNKSSGFFCIAAADGLISARS